MAIRYASSLRSLPFQGESDLDDVTAHPSASLCQGGSSRIHKGERSLDPARRQGRQEDSLGVLAAHARNCLHQRFAIKLDRLGIGHSVLKPETKKPREQQTIEHIMLGLVFRLFFGVT